MLILNAVIVETNVSRSVVNGIDFRQNVFRRDDTTLKAALTELTFFVSTNRADYNLAPWRREPNPLHAIRWTRPGQNLASKTVNEAKRRYKGINKVPKETNTYRHR